MFDCAYASKEGVKSGGALQATTPSLSRSSDCASSSDYLVLALVNTIYFIVPLSAYTFTANVSIGTEAKKRQHGANDYSTVWLRPRGDG